MRRIRNRASKPDGFVMAWFLVLLTLLMTIAAFAVDLGNWYLAAQREQRAADSAALAGAPYLPAKPTQAYNEAVRVLSMNGFSIADTTYIGPDPNRTDYMKVVVKRNVPSIFAKFAGIKSFNLNRTGIAALHGRLKMGSPMNVLGTELGNGPKWASTPGFSSEFTLTQGSAGWPKEYHERFNSNKCTAGEDFCSGSTNLEYRPGGLDYAVDILNNASGRLQIQIYDPQVCTGGNCPPDEETSGPGIPTIVTVYNSPASPDGPLPIPACTHTYPASSGMGWVTVCDINIGSGTYAPGEYRINIDMPSSTSQKYQNVYVMRAGFVNAGGVVDTNASKNVNLYGKGVIVSNHEPTPNLTYFLTQVPTTYAGQTIPVEVYDFGEYGGENIQINWADPAQNPKQPIGCKWTYTATKVTRTPTNGACTFSYPSDAYNGMNKRVIRIDVPIPANYVCTRTETNSCWLMLSSNVYGDATEGSTISVGAPGEPLRLYNPL